VAENGSGASQTGHFSHLPSAFNLSVDILHFAFQQVK
jgi:hypothetical protein